MTERLYYQDAYLTDFSAVVTDIVPYHDCLGIVLDRTAFFPEGGGQPGDVGFINDTPVSDTVSVNGEIIHVIHSGEQFCVGERVNGKVDFSVRFPRMQSHSGEHVFSGTVHSLYGVDNVGFHMDGLVMTVDFNKELSADLLSEIERRANEIVWKNKRITSFFPKKQDSDSLSYRSKLEITESLRIVEIEDCDRCACCAPHVRATGEIGCIKILQSMRHRGGIRITLVCGLAAYEDYCRKHDNALRISSMLKVKPHETSDGVSAFMEKDLLLRQALSAQRARTAELIRDSLPYSTGNLFYLAEGYDASDLRRLAELCKSKCEGVFLAISPTAQNIYAFAIAGKQEFTKEQIGEILNSLNGKGGGRGSMLQGTFCCPLEEIRSYFHCT